MVHLVTLYLLGKKSYEAKYRVRLQNFLSPKLRVNELQIIITWELLELEQCFTHQNVALDEPIYLM